MWILGQQDRCAQNEWRNEVKQVWNECWYRWKNENVMKKAADLIGLCIALAGVFVSISMNFAGRSLWLDEAMLAYSFSERSLGNLTNGIFEWNQSAPVLYLYLVKILTLIFGNTEFVLRSFSIVCYIFVLFFSAYLAKNLFGVNYPMLLAAFLANMNFMLKYANQFKQYMSECVWVLLVFFVYDRYKEKALAWWKMMLFFMLFIWGANPACFFIGGVLLYEFLSGLFLMEKSKKKKEEKNTDWNKGLQIVKNSLLTGLGVGVSFLTYYIYWLRGTATSSEMQDFWQNADFPLIPKNIEDLKRAKAFIYEIFITFREGRLFITALVLAALIIGIWIERNRYCIVAALGFLIALFASYIHMFPIADRLWCFSFPIFSMLAFYAAGKMAESGKAAQLAAIVLMLTLILTNNGISVYRHTENVYWRKEEINSSIAYVQENIREDEQVYVYYHSIPAVKYKIGYDTDCIGAVSEDNIIWGSTTLEKEEAQDDIQKVVDADKCYILASHTTPERFEPLLRVAKEQGNLEIVQNEYETPLYYYSRKPEDMKASAAYELISQEEEGDTCYVTIRVYNTGESIINTEFDNVRLACREREEIGTNLWGNLLPGAYYDMPMQFDWDGATEVAIQLCNEGRYWYEELGTAPITVTRGE